MSPWLKTDYFDDFQCKCGDCRHSCCRGWQINVNEQEYFRLIGMNCSDELHHRLECAFSQPQRPTEACYRTIAPNWLGQCHMLAEDGLCMLHRECGAAALPQVCNFYPRSLKRIGNFQLACCSGSCEKVIELLLSQDRLQLLEHEEAFEPLLSLQAQDASLELTMRCVQLVQDRTKSLGERIDAIA